MSKERAFEGAKELVWWAHYNKPMHQKTGMDILTIHYKGECRYVRNVDSERGWHTHIRKQQPRMVIKGTCRGIIWNGYCTDTNTWEHAAIK